MKHAREDYQRIQDPNNLIPEDEPVFLIRGKDKVAAEAVRAWADLAEKAGASINITMAAREHANAIEEYQKTHEPQVPDMP